MSLLDLHTEDALAAAPSYVPPPRPEPRFSAWSAIPRGIGEAGLQVGATAADVWGALRTMRDATPEQRKRMDRQGLPVEAFSSKEGDRLRTVGQGLRPDPIDASAAEQVLYGFARGASKIVAGAVVGGIPGVMAAGVEEGITQSDELRRAGVDVSTRAQAGLVQGAGLALAALPAAGATLKSTAALYLAGGPGGYVAQQALTREVLKRGGYGQQADQYDPFDPVGLAVSALVPLPFAALGLRANRASAAAKAAEDFRAGPVPSEPTPVALAAAEAMPRDVTDAALVVHLAERRAAAHLGDEAAAPRHEAAMARAEEQIARGEAVNVVDVAPRGLTAAERDANFRAWFGDSVIKNEDGTPMVVYHGTGRDFQAFSPDRLGDNTGVSDAREGFFFSSSGQDASEYAWKDGEPGQVMPVYLSMKNPLVTDFIVTAANNREFAKVIQQAKKDGHDGVAAYLDTFGRESSVFVAFKPGQVKSAIGNSGRFDPNSPSLTDPLADFASAVDQLRAAMQPEEPRAPRTAPPPNPEATTPARGAGDAPAASAAAAGRPAAAVESAGLDGAAATPGAQAEAAAVSARLAQLQVERPDLQVMVDGMDRPLPLAEFLAAVKAEADEMAADAPLVQTLAECALVNGP